MKKLFCLLLTLLMLPIALAEGFDNAALKQDENLYTLDVFQSVDTLVRMQNQPYSGEMDPMGKYDYGELYVYIDYRIMPTLEMTLIQLTASVTVYEPLRAQEVAFEVSGQRYTFPMACEQSEYDGIYMEDYATCLNDESLAFLKALAQQKKDEPIRVIFLDLGETLLTGRVILPGQDAATLYDRYIDLGGKKQNLKALRETYPCKVEKIK